MIRARGLHKTRGGAEVLAAIDLEVGRGEAMALVGTNGAGRSTLVAILATLVRPSAGRLELDGIDALADPVVARGRVGYLPESPRIPPVITAREQLAFIAACRGLDGPGAKRAVESALSELDLPADMPAGRLSRGRVQRLAVASALLGDPPVVLLDRPDCHLDPLARRSLARRLAGLRREGAAIVVALDVVEGLQGLFDSAAVLHRGRLLESRPIGDGPFVPERLLTRLIAEEGLRREGGG